ncbi:hypothetical protein CEJ86_30405 [Sinorhizobium meliloti]|uniref:SsuA/THI5-like domain-containing protein n=2 Tax=Rhizobium meliloti TaxID=382 RepID=A0A2J0YU46_RHIML|nr:hypothetical protein CEJ86_30405 [Sinorhizobium meliloti]
MYECLVGRRNRRHVSWEEISMSSIVSPKQSLAGGLVNRRAVLRGGLALAVAGGVGLRSAGFALAGGSGRISYMTPAAFALSFAEVLIANANGHFKAEGLEVNIIPGANGIQPMQQLMSGQIKVGRTAGIVMATSVEKGVACRAIATLAHDSPLFMVSASTNPINGSADLRGASIGITSPNDPTDLMLKAMLAAGGLADSEVTRQMSADNAGSFALVQAGRLKGFIGNTESINRARATGAEITALNLTPFMPLPGQVYVAMDEDIANSGEDLVAFLKGVRAGIEDIVNDEGYKNTFKTLRTLGLQGIDDEKIASAVMKANVSNWLIDGRDRLLFNNPEKWASGLDAARKIGVLGDKPDDNFYTNALVEKASRV